MPRLGGETSTARRHLLLALRVVIAAAGISYILLQLTWSDQVVFSDGQTQIAYRVVDGEIIGGRAVSDLVVRTGEEDGRTITETVSLLELSDESSRYRLQPGILTVLRHAEFDLLLAGLLLIALIYPAQAIRWHLLMRVRGFDVSVWQAFRLIMVGAFFSFCLPGVISGDVVKAYYAAKRSERRAEVVVSVVMDRVAGLVGLVLLAAIAGLFMLDDHLARKITVGIWLALMVAGVAGIAALSPWIQTSFRSWWPASSRAKESVWVRTGAAFVAYRNHQPALVAAVLISLATHLAAVSATALAGYALGMKTRFGLVLTVVPMILLAGSAPLTYQGLGIMEWLGRRLLVAPPLVSFNQIVGMFAFLRLYQLVYALSGSAFMLHGDIHLQSDRGPGSAAGFSRHAE